MSADSSPPSSVVSLADTVSEWLYAICGWLLIAIGVVMTVTASLNLVDAGLADSSLLGAMVMFGSAFMLIAFGIFVNPRFRRRLERRHEPTQFGRVRSVDQRTIGPEEECDETCISCQGTIETGLIRRYREESAIAGVPVYTHSEGYNHYCLQCASSEVLGEPPADVDGADDHQSRRSEDEPLFDRQ
ncbi:hypothetical protein G6M89_11330 [Natronolimnobius sp. AArcel1]|uniref:hypothetical protein n=1 Tax=Natronolimnobius sp. AArcel1 TaxID=1679093 RepID=UPI0013EB7C9A|nr:hypothetical protein [Natronolimnobius sp. AArcel1]NGM69589.1 hypothetical protein [Natronolimnobius sp. AArcel1]